MIKLSICCFPRRHIFALMVAYGVVAEVGAAENVRLLEFSSQVLGGASSSVAVSGNNGNMEVSPYTGESFIAADHTYIARNPGFPVGTTYKVSPNNNVFYEIGVGDQRASSTQYISAKCVNPLSLLLESCNFGDEISFPRTFNPVGAGTYAQQAQVVWNAGSMQLEVTTPGSGNIQSNGLKIKLTPYVREITFRATNSAGADFIYGDVRIADSPSVSKSFSPTTISLGGRSTLIILLKNPSLGTVVPGANLTDILPSPLRLVSASHSCQGGSFTAVSGSSTISLTNTSIPITGCQVTAEVEWPKTTEAANICLSSPTITNTITPANSSSVRSALLGNKDGALTGEFNTTLGQMQVPATATLTCSGSATTNATGVEPIPVLDEVGLIATSSMLGLVGLYLQRRRKKKSAT
ncbi:IPTL-CTERM sorting domain-containing protein [Acidovorax sp. DW039]|uniref:DUF7933 domain-containing protein n=1 Tax=Acidovorax sp. DW039 TaxID=3095606 RepID=UPI0030856BFE|nr:IPTL-CTERM sorting domain-containing protein [Acidovorax sp. DW039]